MIRSFQISAVFPNLTVLENVRIALQRKLGTSFHFWKREKHARRAQRPRDGAAGARGPRADSRASHAGELAYGRKRTLEIATTLAMEPELMLLDEPTAGMGHEDVDRVKDLIKEVAAGRTVLMVEHNMSVVSGICDTITVLQRGAVLAEGAYAEVSANPQVIEAYMGATERGAMADEVLRIADLHAWYGESHVLHGVDLTVNKGEVVTLLGRNGAGRTSTLKSILGLVGPAHRLDRGRTARDGRPGPPTASRTWASATAPRSAASSPASPWRRT